MSLAGDWGETSGGTDGKRETVREMVREIGREEGREREDQKRAQRVKRSKGERETSEKGERERRKETTVERSIGRVKKETLELEKGRKVGQEIKQTKTGASLSDRNHKDTDSRYTHIQTHHAPTKIHRQERERSKRRTNGGPLPGQRGDVRPIESGHRTLSGHA